MNILKMYVAKNLECNNIIKNYSRILTKMLMFYFINIFEGTNACHLSPFANLSRHIPCPGLHKFHRCGTGKPCTYTIVYI